MSIFGAAKRGLGLLGKLRPKPKPKPTAKPRPQTKHEKEQAFANLDPFVRGKILSARESARKGDVFKGTSVMGRPSKERSAESLKKFWGPRSYQLTDPARKRKGPGKAEGGRIGFKRAGPVTKADLAKRDLWTKRELRRRSQIGQRKSKWDIKGGISGHPLNPLRIHAAEKAYEPWRKRSDVYVRTRDDLKKSRDKKLQGIGKAFQQMDYKKEAKGTQFEKDYVPKLTKRVHVGRQRKFAGALVRGAKNIVKHTPWRKELAGLKKTHRAKQKILKGRAARKEAASKAA